MQQRREVLPLPARIRELESGNVAYLIGDMKEIGVPVELVHRVADLIIQYRGDK